MNARKDQITKIAKALIDNAITPMEGEYIPIVSVVFVMLSYMD